MEHSPPTISYTRVVTVTLSFVLTFALAMAWWRATINVANMGPVAFQKFISIPLIVAALEGITCWIIVNMLSFRYEKIQRTTCVTWDPHEQIYNVGFLSIVCWTCIFAAGTILWV